MKALALILFRMGAFYRDGNETCKAIQEECARRMNGMKRTSIVLPQKAGRRLIKKERKINHVNV